MKKTHMYSEALALIVAAGTSVSIFAQSDGAVEPPLPGGFEPVDDAPAHEFEHPNKLSHFDADGDGTITAAEFVAAGQAMLEEMQSRFLENYDSVPDGQEAGDGIITSEESTAVHEARAEDWLNHVLEALDTNKDGAISSADDSPRRGRRGLGHLRALDMNDDGTVSGEELVAAAQLMAAEMQERFLEKFDSVAEGETAGDGTITGAESLAVHQNHVAERIESLLDRYDLNQDGNVTSAEIDEVHAAKRHGRKAPGFGHGRR